MKVERMSEEEGVGLGYLKGWLSVRVFPAIGGGALCVGVSAA
jgi:hypothetical protein